MKIEIVRSKQPGAKNKTFLSLYIGDRRVAGVKPAITNETVVTWHVEEQDILDAIMEARDLEAK